MGVRSVHKLTRQLLLVDYPSIYRNIINYFLVEKRQEQLIRILDFLTHFYILLVYLLIIIVVWAYGHYGPPRGITLWGLTPKDLAPQRRVTPQGVNPPRG